jgi:hypothetical protein
MNDLVKRARDHAAAMGWRFDMDNAPRNGDRMLGCREDAGPFWMIFAAPEDWLSEREINDIIRDQCGDGWGLDQEDFFSFERDGLHRLEGDMAPTAWRFPPDIPDTPDLTAALLVSMADEVERLREALREAERDMTCGERDDAHYCPNCDNTSFKAREAIRRALTGEQGDE